MCVSEREGGGRGENEKGRERESEGGKEREGRRKGEKIIICYYNFHFCNLFLHRKDWAAHFSVRNLNALSAYPVIVNPTHYVGDEGWFSDTEPPPDILAQIRERKKKEEAEEKRKLVEEKTHQEAGGGEDSPGEGQGGRHQQTDTGHEAKAQGN